jgi:hypothetical protein
MNADKKMTSQISTVARRLMVDVNAFSESPVR